MHAYGFSGLFGIKDEKRLLITFGYEFNVMLTVRAAWLSYPTVALVIIFWLYCFELAYRSNKKWGHLILAAASEIIFLQLDFYHCFLYGCIFLVYIFCRTFTEKKRILESLRYILLYGIFAFFGVMDEVTASFSGTVSSNRFNNGLDDFIKNISFGIDWNMLYEAFKRTIGQTIGGIGGVAGYDFVGRDNFLEGPAFYFGILMFILIPVALYNLQKPKKLLFILGFFAAFLLITMQTIRTFVGGFAVDSFKVTSFWIVILAILAVMELFLTLDKTGLKKRSLLLFNITSGIIFFLMISLLFTNSIVKMNQWWLSFIFFIVYVGLIIVNDINFFT